MRALPGSVGEEQEGVDRLLAQRTAGFEAARRGHGRPAHLDEAPAPAQAPLDLDVLEQGDGREAADLLEGGAAEEEPLVAVGEERVVEPAAPREEAEQGRRGVEAQAEGPGDGSRPIGALLRRS